MSIIFRYSDPKALAWPKNARFEPLKVTSE